MLRMICVSMFLVMAHSAAAEDVKTYTTPDIDIGVESIGAVYGAGRLKTGGSDPDVFLGLEQQVLRRRVSRLEARLEKLEGILVKLHGESAESLIAQMGQSMENVVEPEPGEVSETGAPKQNGLSEIERALRVMDGG